MTNEQASDQTPTMLDAALSYAARGWQVFPAHSIHNSHCSCGHHLMTEAQQKIHKCSPGKHPRTNDGFKSATTNEKKIRAWWHNWPTANIGIVTGAISGLVVLDPDGGDKVGLASLQKLRETLGSDTEPETLTAATGGGGYHLYFQYPANAKVSNGASVNLKKSGYPDIDVRGDGGYVIAPPSNHHSGNSYRWETPLDTPIAALPAAYLVLLTEKPRAKQQNHTNNGPRPTAEGVTYWIDSAVRQVVIEKQGRNDAGIWLAVQLRDNRFSELDAEHAMYAYAALVTGLTDEPYTDSEALASLKQAYSRPPREPAARPTDETDETIRNGYSAKPHGFFREGMTKDGPITMHLSTFTARVLADTIEDDGSGDVKRVYAIEGRCRGRTTLFSVPQSQFDDMKWPSEHMGPKAFITAERSARDHTRVATLTFSDAESQTIYTHTGWRELPDGTMGYLHSGGAIVAENVTAPPIMTKLDRGMMHYSLPAITTRERVAYAVRQFLKVIDLAPDSVMLPLFAAAWRAPLGACDFSLFLSGQSGQKKSAIAALIQQSFGANFNARNFPENWFSTANALELSTFQAKDAIMVIDEYKPSGNAQEVAKYHAKGEQVLRSIGNGSAKGRLGPNLERRADRSPRSLVIVTGEDVPRSDTSSLAARMISIKMPVDGVANLTALSLAQSDAASGIYAEAMAGYITWLAPRITEIQKIGLNGEIVKLRDLLQCGSHARTAPNLANLACGMVYFLQYAQDIGAIDASQADVLWGRLWNTLIETSKAQGIEQHAAKPEVQYAELLRTALASGQAYLMPTDESLNTTTNTFDMRPYGWRNNSPTPNADHIGWIDLETRDIFFIPGAAYGMVVKMARSAGTTFTTSQIQLHRYLAENHLSKRSNCDMQQQSNLAKKTLCGMQLRVLWVAVDFLYPRIGEDIPTDAPNSQEPMKQEPTKPTKDETPISIVPALSSMPPIAASVAPKKPSAHGRPQNQCDMPNCDQPGVAIGSYHYCSKHDGPAREAKGA